MRANSGDAILSLVPFLANAMGVPLSSPVGMSLGLVGVQALVMPEDCSLGPRSRYGPVVYSLRKVEP